MRKIQARLKNVKFIESKGKAPQDKAMEGLAR
jgi:hypothetical protein